MQINLLNQTINDDEIVSRWIHFFYDRISAQDTWKQ